MLLSLIGWSVLPNLVSGFVQNIYYGITIRAGDPKPQQGSEKWKSHRRVIQMLVISAYLFYTIYEADYDLRRESDFYYSLGLPFSATEREIKSRFRRLATQYHPDKATGPEAGQIFIQLKVAADALQSQGMRFAYDRFGPTALKWDKCTTIKDFVTRGVLLGILPYYGIAAASIYVFTFLGYLTFGKYYRWLLLLTVLVFELNITTRPHFPVFLQNINTVLSTLSRHPPLLPFQLVALVRRLVLTMYIAVQQLGPVLQAHLSDSLPQDNKEKEEKATQEMLDHLEKWARQLDEDATRLVDMELAPFKGDSHATSNLQGKVKEWLVQNTIRADPMVKDALGNSLRKRRIDAPAGAKGTR